MYAALAGGTLHCTAVLWALGAVADSGCAAIGHRAACSPGHGPLRAVWHCHNPAIADCCRLRQLAANTVYIMNWGTQASGNRFIYFIWGNLKEIYK